MPQIGNQPQAFLSTLQKLKEESEKNKQEASLALQNAEKAVLLKTQPSFAFEVNEKGKPLSVVISWYDSILNQRFMLFAPIRGEVILMPLSPPRSKTYYMHFCSEVIDFRPGIRAFKQSLMSTGNILSSFSTCLMSLGLLTQGEPVTLQSFYLKLLNHKDIIEVPLSYYSD